MRVSVQRWDSPLKASVCLLVFSFVAVLFFVYFYQIADDQRDAFRHIHRYPKPLFASEACGQAVVPPVRHTWHIWGAATLMWSNTHASPPLRAACTLGKWPSVLITQRPQIKVQCFICRVEPGRRRRGETAAGGGGERKNGLWTSVSRVNIGCSSGVKNKITCLTWTVLDWAEVGGAEWS